jgi:hypothetical protein
VSDDATARDDGDATRREGPGARKTAEQSFAKGTLIGRYVVIDILGAGGMGIVCHTAAVAAENLGYTNVYIMPQGIAGWTKAGKPTEKGASSGL